LHGNSIGDEGIPSLMAGLWWTCTNVWSWLSFLLPQFHFSITQLTDKQYLFWRETHF